MLEKINYEVCGSGNKVVLFLHGWGGSTLSFENAASSLALQYKTINIDFADFGKSESGHKALDVYEHAFLVYKLLNKLEVNTLSIVGHSFGGRIAIILESLFNLNIENLVLVNAAGVKPKFNLFTYLKIKKYKLKKKLHLNVKKCGSTDYRVLSHTMQQSFTKIVNQHLNYLLKYINTKTLIIWGTKDKITPLYMAKKLQKTIKNSGVVFLKNCSHFSYLEKPVQFNLILQSLLSN